MKSKKKRPGGSNATGRPDYSASLWGQMLQNDLHDLRDPETERAKEFRRRFRIPFLLFEKVAEDYEAYRESRGKMKTDCTGRHGIPTKIAVLGVLRMLGRGTCLDGIKELSSVSPAAMSQCFRDFCAWFRKEIYPKFVAPPKNKEELEKAMADYLVLGLNGAFVSIDGVHIHWDKCPNAMKHQYTGKEGFPTVSFNCAVYHDGRFAHVSSGLYGSANDKTAIRFDGFVHDIRTKPFYLQAQFPVKVPLSVCVPTQMSLFGKLTSMNASSSAFVVRPAILPRRWCPVRMLSSMADITCGSRPCLETGSTRTKTSQRKLLSSLSSLSSLSRPLSRPSLAPLSSPLSFAPSLVPSLPLSRPLSYFSSLVPVLSLL